MQINNIYNGFTLVDEQEVKEINSIGKMFIHNKTGARLLYLQNDDDNKVFSIGFRTPPENSTGVAHIIEHSVLCGSRKFPVKEPFVELLKGSLNTFLNAMTFSDKTVYPVASRNDKDFANLIDVYLDAVLYPNIYKYPEIFMQEGWHYELENKEDELTYKGVVYNEMKGAYSSPDSILFRKILASLYPDTAYGVSSGGDPDEIPELSYEEFLDFHKKYYHPANSYIFLYGDMNIEEKLKFIDEEYLNNFEKIEVNSKIQFQKPFSEINEMIIDYPIGSDEKENDRTYMGLNFSIGNSLDAELNLAFEILEYLLLETPSSPLKKVLVDEKLGKDVFGEFSSDILQPEFSIIIKNSNENEKERFKLVVFDTLKKLANEGIDKKLIEAAINIKEFQLKEAEIKGYPKGLFYNLKCFGTWLYDADPLMPLRYEEVIKNIKSALTTNYFEKMIEKYILNNSHSSLVIISPKKGIAEEKANILKEKLAKYKKSLSDVELDNIIRQTQKLHERQNSADESEDLKKIPLLSREDINHNTEKLPLTEKIIKNNKVLFHPVFTNGIYYLNLYFNTDVIEQELINYVGLLSAIMGEVDTKNYSYGDLSNEINIHTGGIKFHATVYADNKNNEAYYPKFIVKSKSVTDKFTRLVSLVGEVLQNSKFDDKKRIKEIIQESKSRLEAMMIDRGHIVASNRLSSYYSSVSKYMDELNGFSFYKFITNLDKNFDEEWDNISKNLQKVSSDIFNMKNLVISITSSEQDYNKFEMEIGKLFNYLGEKAPQSKNYLFDLKPTNEGIKTSAKVQYVAKGFDFKRLGYSYTGSLQVLKTIVSYDYLWNKVRVLGGAYGGFAMIERSGKVSFVSYRDPNLKETLNVYDDAYNYVRDFEGDEREMTKYIIGTISNLDTPLTPSMKGEYADDYYFRKISYKDLQKEREEVLETKADDIRKLSKLVEDAMKQNYICVLGNEDRIKQNSELFNNIINLFE